MIDRIDQACSALPEIRPGAAPYLVRLADHGWASESQPPWKLLQQVVVDVAADDYVARADDPIELLEFNDGAFEVLFDAVHELTVLMHGLSRSTPPNTRDVRYHKGFPRRAGFDKGHALGHAQGGREGGQNYFFQAPRVNRRLSPLGSLWRDLESHLAKNPGSFCFVRLIYAPGDTSDVPVEVEYGLQAEGHFRTVIFPNV